MGIIGSIIIGILAGFLAGKILKGSGFGLIVNLIVGIIGGVLGAIRPAGTECKRSDRQPGDVNHRRNRFTMDRFTIQKRISSLEN